MKTASAETASPAGGVACRGFRLFRPQLTGGIKDPPILGLRHGLAVGDEYALEQWRAHEAEAEPFRIQLAAL